MHQLLYLVAFLSGFAALAFETLWFRQAGLALGNSVWSATLVLSSFMGGLAAGNALVAGVTVSDDNDPDYLKGSGGSDWYFDGLGDELLSSSSETVD